MLLCGTSDREQNIETKQKRFRTDLVCVLFVLIYSTKNSIRIYGSRHCTLAINNVYADVFV